MDKQINIYKDVEALSEGFTLLLKEELAKRDIVHVSLSGGSTPKALFDYWTANCRESIDWNRIAFYWGDERCVPPTDEMSNFGMTKSLLFDKIPTIDQHKIYRIQGENEPNEEARRYTAIIDKCLPKENGLPQFDIMMLGMGDDGHTVSIFPNRIDLWNVEADCITAQHPDTGMERVSLTGRIVNNARNIVFLVTGKNKAEKVKQLVENRKAFINIYPAAKVNPVNGKLFWMLDEDAARLL